jgi:hypothetical protein
MTKKILYQGVPEQVLSENFGAVYPDMVHAQDDGKLALGATATVAYDPISGKFAQPVLLNTSTGLPEIQRTASVIKRTTLLATIGDTAVWTPSTGKRFRWMGFSVVVDPATTTAAGSLVTIKDGATIIDDVIALPVAASNIPFRSFGFLQGNGYLSTAVGNVLNVNLSAAATAGGVYVNVWGTEE